MKLIAATLTALVLLYVLSVLRGHDDRKDARPPLEQDADFGMWGAV